MDKDNCSRLWAALKAQAPETTPPSRVIVEISIEGEDPTANALLNSFIKRGLRSMKHVSIARDQENPHCVIHVKAIAIRPTTGDAVYFLSFVVTRRYGVTDEGIIRAFLTFPSTLSEKDWEDEELCLAANSARMIFMGYMIGCYSTIYVPVVHDAVVVTEGDLRESIEVTLAKWTSEIFQPTVQNIRGLESLANAGQKMSDVFDQELQRREREERGENKDSGQSDRNPDTER